MKASSALLGGLAGASALTIVHQTIKQIDKDAPRMDLLGMDALSKLLKGIGQTPPGEDTLYKLTMAGDIVSNSLYYSLAGIGSKKNIWLRGAVLGLSAGIGAILLPKPLGLNERHSSRSTETKILTVALYLIGGLVTAATIKFLEERKEKRENVL